MASLHDCFVLFHLIRVPVVFQLWPSVSAFSALSLTSVQRQLSPITLSRVPQACLPGVSQCLLGLFLITKAGSAGSCLAFDRSNTIAALMPQPLVEAQYCSCQYNQFFMRNLHECIYLGDCFLVSGNLGVGILVQNGCINLWGVGEGEEMAPNLIIFLEKQFWNKNKTLKPVLLNLLKPALSSDEGFSWSRSSANRKLPSGTCS